MMSIIRRIPWWGYVVVLLLLMFAFGKTKVSVGNVSVGGKDLGGFQYDNSRKQPGQGGASGQ
ncbi:MAG: hypothetical protein KDJ29_01325 [Hyphomicrobiales bacterium]|nr:hypothetical protein [Hyphomicrobiales bacterium]